MYDRKQALGFLLLFLHLPVHLVFPHRAPPSMASLSRANVSRRIGSEIPVAVRWARREDDRPASPCPGMATHGIAGCARFPRDLAQGQALQPGVAHPLPESQSSRSLHRRPVHHQGVSGFPLSGYRQYPREYPLVPAWILADTGGILAERPFGPFFATLEQLFTRKCVFSPPLLRQGGQKLFQCCIFLTTGVRHATLEQLLCERVYESATLEQLFCEPAY